MIIVNVMKLNKNGIIQEYKMKFRSTRENALEIEKLADIAEDCYVDQLNSWKQLTNEGDLMATTRTIRWLAGGGFVDKEVTATTVGQLRSELEISGTADIAVDGTNVADTHELTDGSVVAAVQNNKSGGCQFSVNTEDTGVGKTAPLS